MDDKKQDLINLINRIDNVSIIEFIYGFVVDFLKTINAKS